MFWVSRLRERRSQRAGTLSGGEQQMLAIARGLMSRPKLLLMDEPSLRLALKASDRAYVLEHGRVVLEGSSANLLQNPRVLGTYLGS